MTDVKSKNKTSLAKLRGGEARPPLFFVHPLHGNVFCFGPLAIALGNRQPVYALQSKGLVEGCEPQYSVREMAEYYVDLMLEVDSNGPYFLAGYSMGAYIALDMAHVLRERGKEVAHLFAIETTLEVQSDLDFDVALLGLIFQEAFTPELLQGYRGLEGEAKIDFLLDQAFLTERFPAQLDRAYARKLVRVYEANGWAGGHYMHALQQEDVLKMPITYFLATEKTAFGLMQNSSFYTVDEKKAGDIHYIEGCTHFTIMSPPYVKDLAAKMALALQKIQNAYGIL
jgi:thioesterase domain-containing protein